MTVFSIELSACVTDQQARKVVTSSMQAETLVADFRNRVWLRERIRDYKITAQALELPPALAWKPGWITVVELN